MLGSTVDSVHTSVCGGPAEFSPFSTWSWTGPRILRWMLVALGVQVLYSLEMTSGPFLRPPRIRRHLVYSVQLGPTVDTAPASVYGGWGFPPYFPREGGLGCWRGKASVCISLPSWPLAEHFVQLSAIGRVQWVFEAHGLRWWHQRRACRRGHCHVPGGVHPGTRHAVHCLEPLQKGHTKEVRGNLRVICRRGEQSALNWRLARPLSAPRPCYVEATGRRELAP